MELRLFSVKDIRLNFYFYFLNIMGKKYKFQCQSLRVKLTIYATLEYPFLFLLGKNKTITEFKQF